MSDQIDQKQDAEELLLTQSKMVADAVTRLATRLVQRGFAPETIMDGLVRGAGIIMLSAHHEMTAGDFADLLEDLAATYRTLGKPNLEVVK